MPCLDNSMSDSAFLIITIHNSIALVHNIAYFYVISAIFPLDFGLVSAITNPKQINDNVKSFNFDYSYWSIEVSVISG